LINTKTAFVAIVGKPNVGKSSILNKLLGQKIAIVSDKPQTTRTRITGVLTTTDTQLVFIDTPGLHKPKNTLGEKMVKAVSDGMADVDVCIFVVEPLYKKIPAADEQLIETFKKRKLNVILAINKIDLVKDKQKMLETIAEYNNLFEFAATVPVSAKEGTGMDTLLSEATNFMQSSPFFFDEDTLTDQPERIIAAEMIREKLLLLLEKEIPHGIAVSIESFKERSDKNIIDIEAYIFTEKESHKGIIIGKKGALLKQVGSDARKDLEEFFEVKINLQLWVKVKEDWRNRPGLIRGFELD